MPAARRSAPAHGLHLYCHVQQPPRRRDRPPRRNCRYRHSRSFSAMPHPPGLLPGCPRQTGPAPQRPQDSPPQTLVAERQAAPACWPGIGKVIHPLSDAVAAYEERRASRSRLPRPARYRLSGNRGARTQKPGGGRRGPPPGWWPCVLRIWGSSWGRRPWRSGAGNRRRNCGSAAGSGSRR